MTENQERKPTKQMVANAIRTGFVPLLLTGFVISTMQDSKEDQESSIRNETPIATLLGAQIQPASETGKQIINSLKSKIFGSPFGGGRSGGSGATRTFKPR